jgi:uncharacterized membrane protein
MNTLAKPRITSIDFLRGFIMIIMALDHVRDYLLADSFLYDPLDLEKTSGTLFFTRWITHFCAPIFMLLAGTSAYLIGQKKSKKELSSFLVKRGLWLIFLEMVVVNFGWNFNIKFPMLLFITIWALGVCMIVLAALIHLPKKFILVFCIALIAGHNLFDGFHVAGNTLPAFGWAILHDQQLFTWHNEILLVGYPIVPWIGVMPLGYLMGEWYATGYDAGKRKKNLLTTGFGAIVLFIILRTLNVYGDPSTWSHQSRPLFTFLSFINITKYPPSLLYLLITLGPALLFLGFTEKTNGVFVRIASVYGRVPMFYYLIHIYIVHLIAVITSAFSTHENWRTWILTKPIWVTRGLQGYGFTLPVVYLIWIAVVVAMYPLCIRYDVYKQAHKEKWWLSYL